MEDVTPTLLTYYYPIHTNIFQPFGYVDHQNQTQKSVQFLGMAIQLTC